MTDRAAADGLPVGERARNAPHNTLKGKIYRARETAPEEYQGELKVLSVAHSAWRQDRDPGELWREVLADAE